VASHDPGRGAEASGVLASLRNLAATAVGIVHTRLELLANELEEERVRTLQIAVLGAVALFCGFVGLLLITTWVIVALWEQYRLATIAVLALLYLIAAGFAMAMLKSKASQRPRLFSTSLAELKRDRESLHSQ
jgi:uncharacterized membrane protein YqjE